jgi:hypothetical protein
VAADLWQSFELFEVAYGLKPYKHVQGTHQIEHFFRVAAALDVDKMDIKRYYEFVDQKIADLLLVGPAYGEGR